MLSALGIEDQSLESQHRYVPRTGCWYFHRKQQSSFFFLSIFSPYNQTYYCHESLDRSYYQVTIQFTALELQITGRALPIFNLYGSAPIVLRTYPFRGFGKLTQIKTDFGHGFGSNPALSYVSNIPMLWHSPIKWRNETPQLPAYYNFYGRTLIGLGA
jgi:hypothetical protein